MPLPPKLFLSCGDKHIETWARVSGYKIPGSPLRKLEEESLDLLEKLKPPLLSVDLFTNGDMRVVV